MDPATHAGIITCQRGVGGEILPWGKGVETSKFLIFHQMLPTDNLVVIFTFKCFQIAKVNYTDKKLTIRYSHCILFSQNR